MDRAQRVNEKNEVICLVIMLNIRLTMVNILAESTLKWFSVCVKMEFSQI